jgi:hypothetical protein
MGRKADYTRIAPICRAHHRELHATGKVSGGNCVYHLGWFDAYARITAATWEQLREPQANAPKKSHD